MSRLVIPIIFLVSSILFVPQVLAFGTVITHNTTTTSTVNNHNTVNIITHINLPFFELNSVSPSTINYLQQFKLEGVMFTSTPGTVNFYNSNGGTKLASANVISWSDSEIVAVTPNLPARTRYMVEVVKSDGTRSKQKSVFLNLGQPVITSVTPANSLHGAVVSVNGTDFGSAGTVAIYNSNSQFITNASVKFWFSNKISITLPATLTPSQNYLIGVTAKDGRSTPLFSYHVGP